MAGTWIKYGGEQGVTLKAALQDLEQRAASYFSPNLPIYLATNMMIQMRDGDSSDAAHYKAIADNLATRSDPDSQVPEQEQKNAQAKALLDELESLCFILQDPNSTVAAQKTALQQALAKLKNT